jgi:putative thiazole/oxazole-modified microcin (TOMM)-like peptide
MSMITGTDSPIELDWRFAELVVRTWMEPELARRYAEDPVPVLAEFGLFLTDASAAPRLEAIPEAELVIEDFSGSEADFQRVKSCTSPPCTKDVTRAQPVGAVARSN